MNFTKTYVFQGPVGREWLLQTEVQPMEDLKDALELEEMLNKLQELKADLNSVKGLLSTYDISKWGEHTSAMDPAFQVVKHVTRTVRPRPFCSNAWCKFYELIVSLRLLDNIPHTGVLGAVHLCEAPGGFICALNHYLKSNKIQATYNWLANTLNPYHELSRHGEMIPDDRLIRYTIDRWLFGEDNTGDLRQLNNVDDIDERVKKHFADRGVLLVTSDGSKDCQNNPGEQESIVYPLILSEVLTTLKILKTSGTAVIKMFTFFERQTVSLLYLLYVTFSKITVHKPATSKPGNSEVYVVCEGLLNEDLANQSAQLIMASYESLSPVIEWRRLPVSFVSQVVQCAEYFKSLQTKTILNNVEAYDKPNSQVDKDVQEEHAKDFVSRMGLSSIHSNQSLVQIYASYYHSSHNSGDGACTVNSYGIESTHNATKNKKKRLAGTFIERTRSTDRVTELLSMLPYPEQDITAPRYWCQATCSGSSACNFSASLKLVVSKTPVTTVVNNIFCDKELLDNYRNFPEETIDLFLQASDDDVDPRKHLDIGPAEVVDCPVSVSHLVETISRLNAGGSLVLRHLNCFKRSGAGLLYVFWHCFDEVTIYSHDATNHLPTLVFRRCDMADRKRDRLVNAFRNSLVTGEDVHVLEFTSTPNIRKCTALNRFISDVNDESLRRAFNHRLAVLREQSAAANV